MKTTVIAAALAASLALPATAATIDFTANDDISGSIFGNTVFWSVSGSSGGLSNSTHYNKFGCTDYSWKFACSGSGPYDVGFGINGANGNEIDGKRPDAPDEFVMVTFSQRVVVTGFAGMLTYANSDVKGDREQVILDYLKGDGTWASVIADPKAVIGNSFDTVGLAFLEGLKLYTTSVIFRATGVGSSDDGSFNVTAAGLQVAPVPVPAGLPLLVTGLGALVWAARRKARKAA